jgi:RNA polymerase sigma-70 factor (ECF subfamily)
MRKRLAGAGDNARPLLAVWVYDASRRIGLGIQGPGSRRIQVGRAPAHPRKGAATSGNGRHDDGELAKAVAEGDPAALAELYDRHGAGVYAVCLRVLRDAEEAEEILEDVFFQLWRQARQYDASRGSVAVYLVTLARSRAIERLRVRERRTRLRSEVPDELLGETSVGLASSGTSPLHEALSFERRTHVRRALAELPTEQREAVELAFLEGLSHAEIAERLREPLGTIKTRIRTGLLRMRGALGGGAEAAE